MPAYITKSLAETLEQLGTQAGRRQMAGYLAENSDQIAEDLSKTVLSEIKAFSASRNPDVLPQLADHAPRHIDEIIRLLNGGRIGDFAFVTEHARLRAKQHFPLEATLHAYRCGHRVFAGWLREAVLQTSDEPKKQLEQISATADFALEYTDAASTVLAEAYLAQTRLMADVTIDKRKELMRILLHGYDESDRRVADILREAGYLDGRLSYCVLAVRSVDPAEMLHSERTRRMADSIDQALRDHSIQRVIDVRDNRVVAVVSDMQRLSGWSTSKKPLNERIAEPLLQVGNAILAGISKDCQSTSQIPSAYHEALLALDSATVSKRVARLSDLTLRSIMLQSAGPDMASALPVWTTALVEADNKAGGALIDTLRAYAAADMNVLKAGARLDAHPNTVYFRLQKITDATGLDARSFHNLSELLLVADCVALIDGVGVGRA